MDDKELLKMAAMAIGRLAYDGTPDISQDGDQEWNPLDDDGDALRLAIALHIDLNFETDCDSVIAGLNHGVKVTAVHQLDDVGARRAIVRAAAQIGKSLP